MTTWMRHTVIGLGALAAVALVLTQPYGVTPSPALFVVAAVLVALSLVLLVTLPARLTPALARARADRPAAPLRSAAPDAPGRPMPRAPGDDDFWSSSC